MLTMSTYIDQENDRIILTTLGSRSFATIISQKENLEIEIKNILNCYKVSEFTIIIAVDKNVKEVTCKIEDVPKLINFL